MRAAQFAIAALCLFMASVTFYQAGPYFLVAALICVGCMCVAFGVER
jgi:hypothetical protein